MRGANGSEPRVQSREMGAQGRERGAQGGKSGVEGRGKKRKEKRMKGILKEELIGLDTEVLEAKNKSLKGLKGRIIDETKFTLKVETAGKVKTILKEQVTLKLPYKGRKLAVEGKLLIGRPYERLKR